MKTIGRRPLLQFAGAALAAPALAATERERVLRFMPQVDLVTLAAALQRECLDTVPLVPGGVTLQPAAWRADLEGVLGGVPKFWNVRRRA